MMAVSVGQIYRDNDGRHHSPLLVRYIVVLKLLGKKARCASGAVNSDIIERVKANLDNNSEFRPTDVLNAPILWGTWRQVFIRVERLEKHRNRSTGYTLVHGAE
jgi:hypothetical protein